MKRMKIRQRLLIFTLLFFLIEASPGMAAEPGTVVSFGTEEGKIVLYVQNPGEPEAIQCQIGTVLCEDVTYERVLDGNVPVKTFLLLDNSLSVQEKYRPMINEIMTTLAANRLPSEQFTIAVFSDKITYILEDCSDYSQLKQAINGITYEDQETYLTDVLCELLISWSADQEAAYKRIVIVSDGVDNKTIGYTKEELYNLLNKHPYPIYTLGCPNKRGSNNEELKNMFALSRMTQASSWMVVDINDPLTIANEVAAGGDVYRVVITPPAQVSDGTQKGVKLTITSGGSTLESSTQVDMPFASIVETEPATTEAIKETEEETEIESTEPSESEPDFDAEAIQRRQRLFQYAAAATGAVLVITAAAMVLLRFWRKKKSEEAFKEAPDGAFTDKAQQYGNGLGGKTEVSSPKDKSTVLIWGDAHRRGKFYHKLRGTYEWRGSCRKKQ